MLFLNSDFFLIYLLPFVIFFARICDVTIGTLRIILLSKGMKRVAPILGFFEVLIWILIISKVMQHASTFWCYVAYAAGFASGNYIGMMIEEKVALGHVILRFITTKPAGELISILNTKGFGATSIDAEGATGHVNIIFCIVKRDSLNEVVSYIKNFNPNAFYTIEDVKSVSLGIFPPHASSKKSIFEAWRRRGK